MAELTTIGAQQLIFVADNDKNNVNGSTPGQTGIPLTNFKFLLYKDGVEKADETTIAAAPYNLTVDNLGDGRYLVNFDAPEAGKWSLHLRHTTDLILWQFGDWDVNYSYDEITKAGGDGNAEVVFTKATSPVVNRKVSVGFIDYMTIKIKRPTDVDWSSPIFTATLYYWYEAFDDINPIAVSTQS